MAPPITLRCDKCNSVVQAEVLATYRVYDMNMHRSAGFDDIPPPPSAVYLFAKCILCGQPFLTEQKRRNESSDDLGAPARVFPPDATANLDYLPADVKKACLSAHQTYHGGIYDASVAMARKALEIVCSQGDVPKNGRLEDKIKAFFKNADTKILEEWSQTVRVLGNEAVHDKDSDISEKEAKAVLDFLDALFNFLFVLKVEHSALQERGGRRGKKEKKRDEHSDY